MNLYIRRLPVGLGHMCRNTNVEIFDAENRIVGFVTTTVADHLVRTGAVVDLT